MQPKADSIRVACTQQRGSDLALPNQHIVGRRWPELWEQLRNAPTPRDVRELSHTPEWTLRIDGIQLTSAYNRPSEARLQAELVPENSREAHVYGIALGDLPRVLLERAQLERLWVSIMSRSVARESLRLCDHSDWLGDPRVELLLANARSELRRPYAVAPACLSLAGARSARLRDALYLDLQQPFRTAHFAELEAQLARQMQRNRPLIARDGDVRALYGRYRSQTAVVVAAGPSLDVQLDWLRAHRNRVRVIACTTALRSLCRAMVTPDVVAVVDHDPAMRRHFRDVDLESLRRVPLVYVPSVDRGLLEAWQGPRLAAYLQRPRFAQLLREQPRGRLFCAGTVAHACVDLAVKSGAREVVLLGFDFAFPAGRSHAQHAGSLHDLGRGAAPMHLRNRHGHEVPTNSSFLGYLRDLEAYIRRSAGVTFYHGRGEGALIAGTRALEQLECGEAAPAAETGRLEELEHA